METICQTPPVFRVSHSTSEAHIRWKTALPYTDDMHDLMDALRDVLGQGIHYTNDVYAAILARYTFTSEELAQGSAEVKGGALGMDIYYARHAIQALDASAAEAQARRELQPAVGMRLGSCRFPGKTTYRNCEVIAVGAEVTFLGTRGNRRYRVQASCKAIQEAQASAQEPKH